MTTITQSTTRGIVLTSPTYANPIVVEAEVDISNANGAGVYGKVGSWMLQNSGTISGTYGIELDSGGSVENAVNGLISGTNVGISLASISGSVRNSGTIDASAFSGIGVLLGAGGTVVNGLGAVIAGYSNGVVINGGHGTITNSGDIERTGTGQGGSDLGAIVLQKGGTVDNQGSGAVVSGLYGGIYVTGGAGSITNSGTIECPSTEFGPVAIILRDGGQVTNTGADSLIVGGGAGILIAGNMGIITNQGTIETAHSGLYYDAIHLLSGGGISNIGKYATIFANQIAVDINGGTGKLFNTGTVFGYGAAIAMYNGGSVTNSGTNSEIDGGIYITNGSGTVFNSGTIVSNPGLGLAIGDQGIGLMGGSICNSTAGSIIKSYGAGILFFNEFGSVDNAGTITGGLNYNSIKDPQESKLYSGIWLEAGGDVDNTSGLSLVRSATYGIRVSGGVGTVINDGIVEGTGTAGIGIDFAASGTIVNDFANLIINAGTIIGGSAGMAIQFGAGNDVLEIDPGAVFIGGVDGGTGSNELELAEGSQPGTFTGLGTQFTNFETIVVHAGGTWTFTGTNHVDPGARFAEAGALIDTGLLSIAGTGTWAGVTSGAGTLTFTGGRDTFETGARLEVAHWTLSGTARATIDTALDYGGKLTDGAGSSVLIGAGETFTLLSSGSAGGGGTIEIGAEAHLNVSGEITSSQKIAFEASSGTLELADPATFTAGVAGFERGDRIDIRAAGFTYGQSETVSFIENAAKTEGTLTIKDGAAVFALTLFGQYVAAGFKLASDGHGETLITYTTPSSAAVKFVSGHG